MNKKVILYLIFMFILIIGNLFGATKLLIVAPGETFTPGSPKTGSPLPQTIGVPFNVTVYSVDDSTWNVVNTNATVSMSASDTTNFSPQNFSLDQTEGSTPTCKKYPVTITFNTTATGDIIVTANETGGLGLSGDSVTITAQKIDSYQFDTIGSQVAGNSFYITITAKDASNATVTSFNGDASLTAYYSDHTEDLGVVTFTNGVYSGPITLYEATDGSETVYISCSSTTPSANGTSNNFSISPNSLSKLLIIGPGQTYEPGTLSGNGRVGGSEQTSQQTAGVPFYVTVIACDAYWNTITTESSNVTITSSDDLAEFDSFTKSLNQGVAVFSVTLKTVGSGSQNIYVNIDGGGAEQDIDTVPLTHNTLDHFRFTSNISDQTAGSFFVISAVALDAYDNTVTSFNQNNVPLSAWAGSSEIDSNNWQQTNINFSNGIMSSGYVVIYQKAFNVFLRLTYGSATGDSNTFTVNPGAFSKLLLIAPGQYHDPGDITNTNYGVSGTPQPITAGASVSIDVLATDQYGNKVTTINDIVKITSTDTLAEMYGASLPQYVTLTAGDATFNIVLKSSGNQTITGHDEQTSVNDGDVTIYVYPSDIASFEITNISSPLTAGVAFSPIIRVKDEYGNTKTDWEGIVYISSPYTDWALPYESTIELSGTNIWQNGHKWAVSFTASDSGERQVTCYVYRAVTYQAKLFASDNYDDTPDSYSGHIGESSGFTVNPNNASKLQVLAPGMEARPGTADGENNSPTGQAQGQAFTVTINLVDDWWNVVSGVHQIQVTTNDPANSQVGDPLATPPQNIWLSGGTGQCQVVYNSESSAFKVIASDSSDPSITQDETPNIYVFNIDGFDITLPGGAPIGTQVAGVPFTISITAYSDALSKVIATGFNGRVELRASNNYSDSEYCIEPTISDNFVNGICVMQVTLYRAGTNESINVKFGNTSDNSNSFDIVHGTPTKMLVIVDGMTYKPGLAHVGIPGYEGYSGSPKIVNAGEGFDLSLYIVDDNYNRVTSAADVNVTLNSTDSNATVNGISLPTTVTVSHGLFSTNNMVLRTVGSTGQQTITADHPGTVADDTSPPISVRHAALDHFYISAPSGPILAGESFNITIEARDAYDNVCDDRNGGTPFEESVDLSANSGPNTMYPTQYSLSNGTAIASVQLFKAPYSATIQASYSNPSPITGVSNVISTLPNKFERLLILSADGGMQLNNGYFTAEPPTDFPMFTGAPTTKTVNDYDHTPEGYLFRVYSCDAYGNITATADVLGQTVTITTNDKYAYPVTPTTIDASTGEGQFRVIFHTAMEGVTVHAKISLDGIEEFETPPFKTIAGTPYGLQLLVPGLYVENGSGGWITQTSVWDNGVRGDEQSQLSGVYFPVTVLACDMYGNFTEGVNDTIQVTSGDPDPNAIPQSGNPVILTLDNSIATMNARLITPGYIIMQVNDISDTNKNRAWDDYPSIYVSTSGQLLYKIVINDVEYGDGTNSTTAVVSPETFKMDVYVIDSFSQQPVFGANNQFLLEPVLASNPLVTANGTLGITNGQVINGVFSTTNQTYNVSEKIRIKVTDMNSPTQYAYSCIIDFSPNTSTASLEVSANPESIRGGTQSDIIAVLRDSNGNRISGQTVQFSIVKGSGNLNTTTAQTNDNGEAIVYYTGDYLNEKAIIEARYGSLYGYVTVSVSLVDPIAGEVSNYPNPFKAGKENTYISYYLTDDTDVSIKIYNLFGSLVWEKQISAGELGAIGGEVNTIVWDGKNQKGDVVGNGGYICVVEAVIDGEKKKMVRKIAVRK